MYQRLVIHERKFGFLEYLFDRELENVKFYTLRHAKKKKYFMKMAMALQKITQVQKCTVLKEYFKMCKMLYRIRSTVAYTWDVNENAKKE